MSKIKRVKQVLGLSASIGGMIIASKYIKNATVDVPFIFKGFTTLGGAGLGYYVGARAFDGIMEIMGIVIEVGRKTKTIWAETMNNAKDEQDRSESEEDSLKG